MSIGPWSNGGLPCSQLADFDLVEVLNHRVRVQWGKVLGDRLGAADSPSSPRTTDPIGEAILAFQNFGQGFTYGT